MKIKIQELKKEEPLKLIRVSNQVFPDRIKTRIFTDGEIENESKITSININNYYIKGKKYRYGINKLHTKNIFLKNYSYVISYTIAQEWRNFGNACGWFNFVKDVSIYLKDLNDKEALKNAKHVIKELQGYNKHVNYTSPLIMFFSYGNGLETFETKRVSSNVYTLKKKNPK